MDQFERRIVKNKRIDLAQHLTAGHKFVHFLRKQNLIDIEDAVDALDLKPNIARVSKVIASVCKSSTEDAFNKFCETLIYFDLTWLAKEMKTDLLTTRGSNQIDDDVKMEAATLVHRKFGTSKRMCEKDKKDVQALVAVKIQMAKEDWREEVESLQKQIRHFKIQLVQFEEGMISVKEQTVQFIKEKESSLVTLSHDMLSTSDTLRVAVDDHDIISSLRKLLHDLFSRIVRVLKERDILFSEKQDLMKVMGVTDDNSSIMRAVKSRILENNNRAAMNMEKNVVENKRRLIEKQERIDALEAKLSKQEEIMRQQSHELEALRQTKQRDVVDDDQNGKGERKSQKPRQRKISSSSDSAIMETNKPDSKIKSKFLTVPK